jgi:hypothetical protein
MAKFISGLSKELARRGVLRALGAYIVLVWLLAQGLVDLLPAIGFPDWAIRVFLAAAVTATPVVGVVAWKYDLTARGFLRDKVDVANRRMERAGSGAGPTTRISPQRDGRGSILVASWTDLHGGRREQEFDARFRVGRDPQADIRLADDRVSRRHMEVYPVGDEWFVRDLSSLNGTYVEGDRIDVRKIDRRLDVSLDREGPRIGLTVKILQDTQLSTRTSLGSQTGK